MSVDHILADLVAIDSVSSRSNAEIISHLEERCRALGLNTQRHPHVDDRGLEKINLIACTSKTDRIELALVGHTDTVPYDVNWKGALTLTARQGEFFACGACGTKAFI